MSTIEARLRDENETLREENQQLRDVLRPEIKVPTAWKLTGSEATILGVMVKRELATRTAIIAALYSDRADDAPDPKIIDVFVCRLRRKLKADGAVITSHAGQGYSLSPEWRQRLKVGAA